MTVNTPQATVNNSATIKGNIDVQDVASGTWNEKANGNKIVWNAKDKTLKIEANVRVATLTLEKEVTLTVAEGAKVETPVVINAPATIISKESVPAVIKNEVVVTVKTDKDDEGVTVEGTTSNEEIDVKLEAAKKEAAPVQDLISKLPADKDILESGKQILAAKTAYDALSIGAKEVVTIEETTKLDDTVNKFVLFVKADISGLISAKFPKTSTIEEKQALVDTALEDLQIAKTLGLTDTDLGIATNNIDEAIKVINKAIVDEKLTKIKDSYTLEEKTPNTEEAKIAGIKSVVKATINDEAITVTVDKAEGGFKVTLTKDGKESSKVVTVETKSVTLQTPIFEKNKITFNLGEGVTDIADLSAEDVLGSLTYQFRRVGRTKGGLLATFDSKNEITGVLITGDNPEWKTGSLESYELNENKEVTNITFDEFKLMMNERFAKDTNNKNFQGPKYNDVNVEVVNGNLEVTFPDNFIKWDAIHGYTENNYNITAHLDLSVLAPKLDTAGTKATGTGKSSFKITLQGEANGTTETPIKVVLTELK